MSGELEIGPLTDDERSAGLGGLIYGSGNQSDYSVKKPAVQKNELVEIVAGLSKIEEVKDKAIRYILIHSLDEAIKGYALEENLSSEYIGIARQDNGLVILLKLFFKTKVHYQLTKKLVSEIKLFVEYVCTDKANDFVYNRVHKIQKFIHKKVEEKNGQNSHRGLDKHTMREILSTARLHLEITNLKYKNIVLLLELKEKITNLQTKELENLSKPKLLQGQKYVPLWRVNHIKSLIEYYPINSKGHITRVNNFDTSVSLNDYKQKVIKSIKLPNPNIISDGVR